MENYKDFNYCKKLVSEFKQSYLDGDLKKLETFDFLSFYRNKDNKYGLVNGQKYPEFIWKYDPDDSELAKAIYVLIWGNDNNVEYKLPDCSFENIGTGLKYRGDTLNTFNTLFDKNIWWANETNEEIEVKDKEFADLVNGFKKIYLTIGNFSILPNKIPKGKKGINSLNCYRGKVFRDYYDLFLDEFRKCFPESKEKTKKEYLQTLYDENKFYFDEINTFEKFVNKNFLRGYFKDGDTKKLNVIFEKKLAYRDSKSVDSYKEFAKLYIETATLIIKNRSKEMIKILEKTL